MSDIREQLIALGGVFQAAVLVDRVAKTGQISEAALGGMLGTLLIRDPKDTLEVFGGSDDQLQEGYRALAAALERDPATLQREPLRYALSMVTLERQLQKRPAMLDVIGKRLPQIQAQVQHFGPAHENVVAASGGLYQDTLSTLRQRIQVHGDMRHLQQPNNASKIRALLLTGIRCARLWRQLGGHRWQLLVSRRKLLRELYPMLRGH
ncbi:high frequency lysogenization protein HflD [Pseudomonas sp. RIT-PI-S]|uniref:high frequency lysogenization protein HflD n=1 Tax=Pseudomonas sp. RIT-PI-S TaxID=3035295 RepID=UPI0021D923FE|nr:high frequency lysogenization protein HflD [Pseudomonas sp. RIT-PI-S]